MMDNSDHLAGRIRNPAIIRKFPRFAADKFTYILDDGLQKMEIPAQHLGL